MKPDAILKFFLFTILVSGCATYKTPPIQKSVWEDTSSLLNGIRGEPKNLTLQQIQGAIITNSSKLTTFRAHAEMTLATPSMKGPIRCTGLILYQSPRRLRVVGSKFATTIFDLASNGDTFWLSIPPEKKVYTGAFNAFHKIDALGMNIYPGDIITLFNYKEILEGRKPMVETWPAYWLVHTLEADTGNVKLKGNLLVDRVNAEVFRYELFDTNGSAQLQAVFTNYATFGECRMPQKIDMRWPMYDTTLSITFSQVTVNNTLDPKVFTFTIPKGAQTVTID
jgi:outer membrane lipoprotein-sorting protein